MENERRVIGPPGLSLRTREKARARWRLEIALAVSIGFHALLLFLQLGDAGFGLPGLELPWAERRVQATDISARLVELPAPAPVPLAVLPYVPPALVIAEIPKPVKPSLARRPVDPLPPRTARAVPPEAPLSVPRQEIAEPAPAPAAEAPAPKPEIRPEPPPEILAQTEPQPETFKVPPPKPVEPEPAEASRKAEDGRQKEEAAKQLAEETAQREAEERARALALQKELEAKKQAEAKKQDEALRIEVARKQEEVKKQEDAKRAALDAEALKRAEDAARQQAAARQKELEAQRQAAEEARRKEEEARQQAEAAAKQQAEARRKAEEAARQQAAAPGAPSGRDIAAKALEGLRTPGAVQTPGVARVEPPRATALPGSVSGPRRRSVFGVERDVVMRSYVDSWRWKIERFGALNYRPSAAWRALDNPVVTVAIRSDGSLESVHIHKSSGVRELDETVRRIAARYAPYSAFPPALALQYDVIEIRRVWFFDDTLKILEEM